MRLVSECHGSRRKEPPSDPRLSALNCYHFLFFVLVRIILLLPTLTPLSLLPPPAVAETAAAATEAVFLLRRGAPQCLYLDQGVAAREACRPDAAPHVRLRFCDAHALGRLLPEGAPCDAALLDRLRDADERARRVAGRFRRLLRRFDCDTENSVSWTCSDCEAAYKQWVCAMFLPPVRVTGGVEGGGGGLLKPCRYMCRLVEQRCPYFHPSVKEQYAGERVFKCIDPDIPDLESMETASAYGPAGRCYCPHHLDNAPEAGDPECRLLTAAQLRRNASRRGAAAPRASPAPWLLLFLMLLLAATR